jgi:hypothetical protein
MALEAQRVIILFFLQLPQQVAVVVVVLAQVEALAETVVLVAAA